MKTELDELLTLMVKWVNGIVTPTLIFVCFFIHD